jgi:hypothetical protein
MLPSQLRDLLGIRARGQRRYAAGGIEISQEYVAEVFARKARYRINAIIESLVPSMAWNYERESRSGALKRRLNSEAQCSVHGCDDCLCTGETERTDRTAVGLLCYRRVNWFRIAMRKEVVHSLQHLNWAA